MVTGLRKKLLPGLLIPALLVAPAAVRAADKTVGVILSGNLSYYQEVHKAFVKEMEKRGLDYRTVDTLLQMPAPEPLSWTNAARKLTVAEVDVLVTYGAPATLAAIHETRSIPIVFAGVYDPVAVKASARNVAGINAKVPLTSLMKYLRKISSFTRLAVVYCDAEPDSVRQVEELRQLEAQYGFLTVRMPVKRPDAVKRLSFSGTADAVFVSWSSAANEAFDAVVAQARKAKVPVVSQMPTLAERGAVLCLGPSPEEQGAAAARLTARLLAGERLLPSVPEIPRMVEFVVNVKEADALGIAVPGDILKEATRVIP